MSPVERFQSNFFSVLVVIALNVSGKQVSLVMQISIFIEGSETKFLLYTYLEVSEVCGNFQERLEIVRAWSVPVGLSGTPK